MHDYINEHADKLVRYAIPENCWRIKIDGVFITTRSRKTAWGSIGAAKNALHHEFESAKHSTRWGDREHGTRNLLREVSDKEYDEFISKRVEFVRV